MTYSEYFNTVDAKSAEVDSLMENYKSALAKRRERD